MCSVGCILAGAASTRTAGGSGSGFKFAPAPEFKPERHRDDATLSFELITFIFLGGMRAPGNLSDAFIRTLEHGIFFCPEIAWPPGQERPARFLSSRASTRERRRSPSAGKKSQLREDSILRNRNSCPLR